MMLPLVPPACAATIVQVPGVTKWTRPTLLTVQMLGVVDVYVTANVDEAVAVKE